MVWVIKTAKSAIGVIDQAPYFVGIVNGYVFWQSKQKYARCFRSKSVAMETVHLWGPSWRDAVRVVRLVRRPK